MLGQMSTSTPIVVGIGEVLWDLFPGGRQLGGAPANFAYHAHALGAEAFVISGVGDDEDGKQIVEALQHMGLDTRFLQTVRKRPTGTVSVEVDAAGKPHYVIHENVAWDAITWDESMTELALAADAVCLGTLAQRAFITRSTVLAFVQHTRPECLRILDLNVRQGFYSRDLIDTSLQVCNVLKLNDEEWPTIATLLELDPSVPEGVADLMKRYELRLVALTQGSAGSLLVTPETVDAQPGQRVQVVDTVGAGDAFTAGLAMGLLGGEPLPRVHARAARIAAYVCTQAGATPRIPKELVE
jgi:fructokinase